MIVNHLDLDTAVAEGVISRDQAVRLRDLSVRDLAADDSSIDFSQESIDFSQDTRDEPFRLLRGFRDVFIAIGVLIFAVGLSAVAWKVIGLIGPTRGDWSQVGNRSVWVIFIALVLCVFGLLQAELITRKQRLPLSSLVVSVAFATWSALLFVAIAAYLTIAETLNIVQVLIAGAILGVALFYWRYRLPFALFLLAGSLVGLSLLIVNDLMGVQWFVDYGRMVIGLWGVVIFVVAMWFDVKDRLRETRFSECAFWLHLFAAPMLVHALLFGDPLGAPKPGFVLGTMAVLSVIALVIDRRALLVSGLSYFAVAIYQLVSSSVLFGDQTFALTAFILGGFMLTLGLCWTPFRRGALAVLPFDSLKSRLPPTAA